MALSFQVDKELLDQVWINLLQNAIHALDENENENEEEQEEYQEEQINEDNASDSVKSTFIYRV
mgnify:CR=1 FL=1